MISAYRMSVICKKREKKSFNKIFTSQVVRFCIYFPAFLGF